MAAVLSTRIVHTVFQQAIVTAILWVVLSVWLVPDEGVYTIVAIARGDWLRNLNMPTATAQTSSGQEHTEEQTEKVPRKLTPKETVHSDDSSAGQSEDTEQGDVIELYTETVEDCLEEARIALSDGEYEDALKKSRKAIDAAKEARQRVKRDAPGRSQKIDTLRQEAECLAATIEAERDAHQDAVLLLEEADDRLDTAAAAIETGDTSTVRDHLSAAMTHLDDAVNLQADYGFDDLSERFASLQDRHDRLEQQRTRLTLASELDSIESQIEEASELVEVKEYEDALEEFVAAIYDLNALETRIDDHSDETLQDRLDTLRERCVDGRERAEAALTTSSIPR